MRGGKRCQAPLTPNDYNRDGKIVTVGWADMGMSGSWSFALARYNPADGSLDSSFGTGRQSSKLHTEWQKTSLSQIIVSRCPPLNRSKLP